MCSGRFCNLPWQFWVLCGISCAGSQIGRLSPAIRDVFVRSGRALKCTTGSAGASSAIPTTLGVKCPYAVACVGPAGCLGRSELGGGGSYFCCVHFIRSILVYTIALLIPCSGLNICISLTIWLCERARTYGCHPDALTATERQSDLNGRAGPCTTFFIDHYGRSAEELSDWCYH